MNRKWLGKWVAMLLVIAAGSLLVNLSSCAFNQHLISIQLQPGDGTFSAVDPNAFFNYKAFGTYIHPPKTVDITNMVHWQSDNPQVVQILSPGVVSPNTNCGVAQIFASFHDSPNDVVSNLVTVTVDGPASLGCPQGSVTENLSVDVTGAANGVIVSSPSGINCGTTCSAAFAFGSSVALTPTPNTGHTFGGWGVGCTTVTGTTCNVTMNTNVAVSATFN
ncbi:MAG TPA: hypothetical protein VIW68_05620 [Candidatus Sulfotelmatobacter sp.]